MMEAKKFKNSNDVPSEMSKGPKKEHSEDTLMYGGRLSSEWVKNSG